MVKQFYVQGRRGREAVKQKGKLRNTWWVGRGSAGRDPRVGRYTAQ